MSTYVAAPHMTTFRCLGSECEDTCCKAWEIPVTDDDMSRLTTALGPVAASELVHRLPDGSGGTVVVLRKREDRTCPQLSEDRLCTLHARLGEPVLPAICSSYPRQVTRAGDQHELTGRLSCPEVARLCLLADEATQVVAPIEAFGRFKARDAESDKPYAQPFLAVREKLIELAMAPGYSVASRLYFIAALAERIGAYFHRDAATLEAERLTADLAAVGDPELQAELHAQRGASSPMNGIALQLAQGLIYSRLDVAPAFARVAVKAAHTHGVTAGVTDRADMLKQLAQLGPERLWRSHMARRQSIGAGVNERLEQVLARYCRSYFLQDSYAQSPDLLEHVMLLLLRVTLIRFLLVGHPDISTATDAAAVEVVYAVTRAYDHNTSIREGLAAMLRSNGLVSLDHAAALLKL